MRFFLALPLSLFTACSSPPVTTPPPVDEESVRPGANDSFLADDVDIEDYIDRFEGESREIASSRDYIVAVLDLRPGMDIADIGAGTGLFLEPFAEGIGTTGTLYAVDIAPAFVEHLEGRIVDAGYSQVEVVQCSDRSSNLPPASVDLAFLCDTYHHVEYPKSTLASLYAALRPGGMLVVIDFERIPGVTREWILGHVRAGKDVVRSEIEAAGFHYLDDVEVEGLEENYLIRFRRP